MQLLIAVLALNFLGQRYTAYQATVEPELRVCQRCLLLTVVLFVTPIILYKAYSLAAILLTISLLSYYLEGNPF